MKYPYDLVLGFWKIKLKYIRGLIISAGILVLLSQFFWKAVRLFFMILSGSAGDGLWGLINFTVFFLSSTTSDSSCFLQVVLAANDMPSINDITYDELVQVISKVRHPQSTKDWCADNLILLESNQNWMVSKFLSQHVAYVCSSTTCLHPIQSPFSVWPVQVGWIAVCFWATWSWLCCWVFIWMFINNL